MKVSKRLGAAERARWLADLAHAIDEAQRVAWRIGVVEGTSSVALELYVRLEAARLEVEALCGAPVAEHRRPWPVPEWPVTATPVRESS